MKAKKEYIFIASFIFIFAFQQAVEGGIWLSISEGKSEDVRLLAMIFFFFSHFIWLFLAPLSTVLMEISPSKRRLLFFFTVVGFLFGSSLYLPLFFNDDWFSVKVVNFSIFYDVRLIYDAYLSKDVVGIIYASIIIIPMFLSSNRHIRFFGAMIFLSGLPAYFSYYHAFISIWCFFAGVISLYIVYILSRVSIIERGQRGRLVY